MLIRCNLNFFFQVWLEMPIHTPKILVIKTPKRHLLGRTALTCQFWCRSVHWSTCAPDEGIKKRRRKRKKARKETYSGKLSVRPDHPRWCSDMVLHAGWSSGGSSKFQVSSKSGERFSSRAVGGRKLPFPILKASGLYNSLYYHTSRDTYIHTYILLANMSLPK